jgi:hypothetical protein
MGRDLAVEHQENAGHGRITARRAKIIANPGDIIETKYYTRESGHFKLIDFSLNNQLIDGHWFLYPPHWEYDFIFRGGDAHD